MLRKAFPQLRNVEIDEDLQLHTMHVGSLNCHCAAVFAEGEAHAAPLGTQFLVFLPMAPWLACVCFS